MNIHLDMERTLTSLSIDLLFTSTYNITVEYFIYSFIDSYTKSDITNIKFKMLILKHITRIYNNLKMYTSITITKNLLINIMYTNNNYLTREFIKTKYLINKLVKLLNKQLLIKLPKHLI